MKETVCRDDGEGGIEEDEEGDSFSQAEEEEEGKFKVLSSQASCSRASVGTREGSLYNWTDRKRENERRPTVMVIGYTTVY